MRHGRIALGFVCLLATACSGPPRLEAPRPAVEDGQFLVSPRWSEDGRQLVAAGRDGKGLHLIDLAAARRELVDPGHVGRLALAPNASGPPAPAADAARQRVTPQVWFETYRGRVEREVAGRTDVLTESGAWGVVAGPDGWVAWCVGPLAHAELHTLSPGGARTSLGHGAQPAWAPRAPVLVFAQPEEAPETGEIVRSDLWAWDGRQERLTRLTQTPEAVEMQPTVSPDGAQLAYADWRSGRILVAVLATD